MSAHDIIQGLTASIEAAHEGAGDAFRIGVYMGPGHGDHPYGLAICSALRQKHPKANIFGFMCYTGTMCEWDMAHQAVQAGILDAYAVAPRLDFGLVKAELLQHFDVFYNAVPYAVGEWWNLERNPDADLSQQQAQCRLAEYQALYDGYPHEMWRLKRIPMTRFGIMSITSGLSISFEDIMAPVECAPFPESVIGAPPEEVERLKEMDGVTNPEKASTHGLGDYVVLHNGAGPNSFTKTAPPAIFKAVIEALAKIDVRCVQVGRASEDEIKGAVQRRGLRLPLTNQIISGAVTGVYNEGFLPVMSCGLMRPCAVLFGPTPLHTYAISGQLPILGNRGAGDESELPCPYGSCFCDRAITMTSKWAMRCPLGSKNPTFPYCQNFAAPGLVAEKVTNFVQMLRGRVPTPAAGRIEIARA